MSLFDVKPISYSFHQFPTRWYHPTKKELDYFQRNRLRIKRQIFKQLEKVDVDPNAIAVWDLGAATYGDMCLFFLLERRHARTH